MFAADSSTEFHHLTLDKNFGQSRPGDCWNNSKFRVLIKQDAYSDTYLTQFVALRAPAFAGTVDVALLGWFCGLNFRDCLTALPHANTKDFRTLYSKLPRPLVTVDGQISAVQVLRQQYGTASGCDIP